MEASVGGGGEKGVTLYVCVIMRSIFVIVPQRHHGRHMVNIQRPIQIYTHTPLSSPFKYFDPCAPVR